MLAIFLAALVSADRNLSITLTVDNNWTMDITGHPTIDGPNNWKDVKTFNKTLKGEGPWVIAIKGVDNGGVAGFFSSVSVDNRRFAVTGDALHNKWSVSDKNEIGWKTLGFNDSKWGHNFMPAADCYVDDWEAQDADFHDKLRANQALSKTILPIWYPNCNSINKENYFRLVIPPKSYIRRNFLLPGNSLRG
jgi:hypothetical protein